jgi:hypothetical protein
MRQIILKRFYIPKNVDINNQTEGTLGLLFIDNSFFCFTLEPPWRENKEDSCIPSGVYNCRRYSSPKFPNTFEVKNVPNRKSILFHSGNLDKDTLGCILLGDGVDISNKKMILNSKLAFERFLKKMEGVNEFVLRIENLV